MKLETLRQSEAFWAAICFDGKFKPKGRYQVYRELVTERLMQTLQNISPVARALLSEREWWRLLWDYLKNSPPKSEILRELAWELSQYLKSHRHPLQKKYPYLGELLEYEYLEIAMRFAPEDQGKAQRGKLRLNPAHVLATYCWPVHFISEEFRDPKKLPQGEYHLLLWREPDSLEVKFMELNSLVVALVRRLERGPCSPDALLKSVAKAHAIKPDAEYLKEGRALLADLGVKKILL
ncbi:MAG: putative DNA-binding domain-containing protein [bacterium]